MNWRMAHGRPSGFRHPQLASGWATQTDLPLAYGERKRAVVVAGLHFDLDARADALLLEKFQKLAVALIEAGDAVARARLGLGQKLQPFFAPGLGTAQGQAVAMRTGVLVAELFDQLFFKGRRDGVLQPLGLVMHLKPLHAKNFRQHALDQMMAKESALGD